MNTKINEQIHRVLSKFGEKYYIEGNLHKNKVIQDLENYNQDLLNELLSNEVIKENFTIDINGNIVFQTNKLIELFEVDEYWKDSFTKYSKKIGLTAGGKFIDENEDVVLDFPYKDTILKASMSKEDTDKDDLRPDEPFLNEVIAKEEIDVLLDKKILVNAKKYDQDGVREVNSFSEDDNLIIKGNNLLALHTLKERYAGKVKVIYIDPPYNTENDEFKYNDRFKHSTWLTFMKNRLDIAKDLLMDQGLIFIHIGDQEMHYLKVLSDEIFGREYFIATIPRKTRNGKSDVPYKLSQDFDWMLVYTKRANKSEKLFQRTIERKYYKTADFPNDEWRLTDLTKQTSVKERPNSNFTLVNPRTGEEYPVDPNRSWAITKDTVDDYIRRNKIVFPGDYDFLNITKPYMRVFKSEEIEKYGEDFDKTYVSTEFLNKAMDDLLKNTVNKKGTDEMKSLFGEKAFSYPKNELLLQRIIEYCTNEGDIVLDFFMGSATTQAVAHKMNRRYIGIEQMDYINTVSVPRLQKVIEGEQGGISKDVNWQGGGSFVYVELMEKNRGFLKAIRDAKNHNELQKVFNFMLEEAEIDFRVDLEKVKDTLHELSLDDQKRCLIKIIDKNQLYYNYSEIDDEHVRDLISDSDYAFNKSFYEEGEE